VPPPVHAGGPCCRSRFGRTTSRRRVGVPRSCTASSLLAAPTQPRCVPRARATTRSRARRSPGRRSAGGRRAPAATPRGARAASTRPGRSSPPSRPRAGPRARRDGRQPVDLGERGVRQGNVRADLEPGLARPAHREAVSPRTRPPQELPVVLGAEAVEVHPDRGRAALLAAATTSSLGPDARRAARRGEDRVVGAAQVRREPPDVGRLRVRGHLVHRVRRKWKPARRRSPRAPRART